MSQLPPSNYNHPYSLLRSHPCNLLPAHLFTTPDPPPLFPATFPAPITLPAARRAASVSIPHRPLIDERGRCRPGANESLVRRSLEQPPEHPTVVSPPPLQTNLRQKPPRRPSDCRPRPPHRPRLPSPTPDHRQPAAPMV